MGCACVLDEGKTGHAVQRFQVAVETSLSAQSLTDTVPRFLPAVVVPRAGSMTRGNCATGVHGLRHSSEAERKSLVDASRTRGRQNGGLGNWSICLDFRLSLLLTVPSAGGGVRTVSDACTSISAVRGLEYICVLWW